MNKVRKLIWVLTSISSIYKLSTKEMRNLRQNRLAQLAMKYDSDKGPHRHAYTDTYHELLGKLRYRPIALLELGLLNHKIQRASESTSFGDAPSLKMWLEYAPQATIVGFDIADFSKVSLDRATIVRGDQSSRVDLDRISEAHSGQFDIIIDDALHTSQHQQVSLAHLFPKLKPGGLYFVEDLRFQPEEFENTSCPKTLDYLRALKCGRSIESPVVTREEQEYLENNIESISFYDGLWRRKARSMMTDSLALLVKRR